MSNDTVGPEEMARIIWGPNSSDRMRFRDWALDRGGAYPSEAAFKNWERLKLVLLAEEGWALTSMGRALAHCSSTAPDEEET